jgi:hypothetical protein
MGETIQPMGEIRLAHRIIAVEVAESIAEYLTVFMGTAHYPYFAPRGIRISASDDWVCGGTECYTRRSIFSACCSNVSGQVRTNHRGSTQHRSTSRSNR